MGAPPTGAVGHYGGLAALPPNRVKLSAMSTKSSTARTDKRKAKQGLSPQQHIFVLAIKPLTNTRHERFSQLLFEGKTADNAYATAGYKPDRHHAAQLNANESIQARVVSVYDGDTLTVDAEPWPGLTARTSVRVAGVDTPEIRGECQAEKDLAVQARDFVRSTVGAQVQLTNVRLTSPWVASQWSRHRGHP